MSNLDIFGKKKIHALEQQLQEAGASLSQLEQIRNRLEEELEANSQKLSTTQKERQQLKNQLLLAAQETAAAEQTIKALSETIRSTESDRDGLAQELAQCRLWQNLVAALLSASNQNPGVADYFDALHHDFLEFSNHTDVLEDAAAVLLELQEIGAELKVVGAYPDFYKKRAVAIAGGFSAGKSEFINSLFANPAVRLPVGINPTTAIPTYALNGSSNGLIGCSQNGGIIDLLAIDPNFQNKLSHRFIESFGFNLKTILPFMFLTTPLPYEHLCLIDTPGYNPADMAESYTHEDIKTANEFIHNSEALLWLIGLDTNGTIGKSDLDFLSQAWHQTNKPLYLVLNKADGKSADDLQDIMDEIAETLADYDIEITGISAYSSINKHEYLYHKQSLQDFLARLNTPSDKHSLLLKRLYAVDEKYQRAILRSIKEDKQVLHTLNALKLDLLQQGLDDLDTAIYEKIGKLNLLYTTKHKEEHLHKLARLTEKLAAAIDCVFGHSGSLKRPIFTLDDIELNEKFNRLTQKDELPEEVLISDTNKPKAKKKTVKPKAKSQPEPESKPEPDTTKSVSSFLSLFINNMKNNT